MRALKFIVIGMGALIVLAVGLIGFGLYKKSVDPGWKLFGTRPDVRAPAADAAPGSFGDIELGLPDGCVLASARPEGRRLFIRTSGDSPKCDAVFVIDSEDGRILGRIAPR